MRSYGGEVDLVDTRPRRRAAKVAEVSRRHPDAYLGSAYDDALVIAGNARSDTSSQRSPPEPFDAVVVPLGGGGLTSGVVHGLQRAGIRHRRLGRRAAARQRRGAQSCARGESSATSPTEAATIADGARTLALGKHNWAILEHGAGRHRRGRRGGDPRRRAAALRRSPTSRPSRPERSTIGAAPDLSPSASATRSGRCVVSGGNVDPAALPRAPPEPA